MRRISIEVEEGLFNRLNETLPWGVRAAVVRTVLDMIVDATERNGPEFLGILLNGEITLASKPPIEVTDGQQ